MYEKRLLINNPLRKTFNELYTVYGLFQLTLKPEGKHNKPLQRKLHALWTQFELTKLPMRLAFSDARAGKARSRKQFYIWLRSQREIKMIAEHEENIAGYQRAA